ncbi:anthranilate synthase / indole-3-glycerol phosphate synthase [Coemansia sp. RSA 2322]|nr:anthranilate synthase / indole-3-glycerol phosphate synthase [Coemansia sp. RSA 2322]
MGSNEMVEDHASDNSSEAPMLTSDLHERISRDSTTNEYFSKCNQHIFGQTRRRPLLAGVFQNQDVEYIISVARSVPLDLVQLHGSEPLDMARNIPVPVIKVFHVDDQFSLDSNSDMFQTFYHSIILLDTKVGGTDQQGGKGVSFDWSIARQVADKGVPFMMAGGLTAENVAQAVAVGQPWGVDVSSGIETNKTKDPTKIRAFVNNAKCG